MLDHSTVLSNVPKRDVSGKSKWKRAGKVILFSFLTLFLIIFLGIGVFFIRFPMFAKAAYNFVALPKNPISSGSGYVNILVMGKSGGSHEGSELTDSMLIISLPLEGMSKITTVSIPRDIWIPELRAKINSVYYWGKEGTPYFKVEETGGGISFAKKITGGVIGQQIDYGVVVDFSAFKDTVDAIGGIEVNVERGFIDKLYPIEGKENDMCEGDSTYACRYEEVVFDSGLQQMDGETALKFVRSRHAEGDEGTDIAREARQQKVIKSIENKIMSKDVLFSPGKIANIFDIAEKYVETDIDIPTAGILARLTYESRNNVSQNVLPEDLLVNPKPSKDYDNLYVFIPKAGNGKWEEIQNWFRVVNGD
ncbi:MAG: cell envelope-related transcriptional attenuator [uncultured bacterium]|nr:MAG: cell envelope-related transcriptional attenuator [uncultured bacterium]